MSKVCVKEEKIGVTTMKLNPFALHVKWGRGGRLLLSCENICCLWASMKPEQQLLTLHVPPVRRRSWGVLTYLAHGAAVGEASFGEPDDFIGRLVAHHVQVVLQRRVFGSLEVNQLCCFVHPNLRTAWTLNTQKNKQSDQNILTLYINSDGNCIYGPGHLWPKSLTGM